MALIGHAEREMRAAGLYDDDADYGGLIPQAVMALVRAHSEQGHSGGSHYLVLSIFNKVINFKPLTPIGSTPDEWVHVGDKLWQNSRAYSVFSEDGGKTWYDIDNLSRWRKVRRWFAAVRWGLGFRFRKMTGTLPKEGLADVAGGTEGIMGGGAGE